MNKLLQGVYKMIALIIGVELLGKLVSAHPEVGYVEINLAQDIYDYYQKEDAMRKLARKALEQRLVDEIDQKFGKKRLV